MNGIANRLAGLIGALALAGCGGGGGGGMTATVSTDTASSDSSTSLPSPLPSQATIQPAFAPAYPPGTNSLIVSGTVLLSATDFHGSPTAPIGFSLNQTNLLANSTQIEALHANFGGHLSWKGNQTINGQLQPVYDFIDGFTGGEVTQITGDATPVADNKGDQVVLGADTLNYTLFAVWAVRANGPSPQSYVGVGVDGFGSAQSGIPASGTASYVGNGSNGGAVGLIFAPSSDGTSILGGALTGNASVNVNFGAGTVTGALTNMTVTPTTGGSATPWNNVSLAGSLSGAPAAISGTTTTNASVSGPLGMSSSSSGSFSGNFYGPAAQEIGAAWTLNDPSGQGKTAIGVLGATKQ